MRRSMSRIPELVRIKPGAMDRLGLYLGRAGHTSVTAITSQGLMGPASHKLTAALDAQEIALLGSFEVAGPTFEEAAALLARLPFGTQALLGVGGAKALDVAKYVASLADLPYYAVPTSLSSDSFCSPHSSLTVQGKRRTLATVLPWAVIMDTDVCRQAPNNLWCAGVGDLVAKLTAVSDWRLAFHSRGTPINDFAALLSDATVHQFAAHPTKDSEGARLLGTALMLNGIAMEMAGSTRPASGSEHLISHALDRVGMHPRLHGLQVGTAAYVVSHLQGANAAFIGRLLEETGFWDVIKQDPFVMQEWRQALVLAPSMKSDYYTILSHRDVWPEVEKLLKADPYLSRCFIS